MKINGHLELPATARVYLDNGGDTYIVEAAADRVDIYAGGVASMLIGATQVDTNVNFAIQPTKRLYLDGGSDTYILESAANVLSFYVGGVRRFGIEASTGAFIETAQRFYFDGGADTYIYEVGPNNIRVVAGGSNAASFATTFSEVFGDFYIQSTKKLYLDGGGDTYLTESSANIASVVVGGLTRFSVNGPSAYVHALASDLIVDATKKFYLDGGGDTYISETSTNIVRHYASGTEIFAISVNGFDPTVDIRMLATKKLYLDGGSDTYIYEGAPNQIYFQSGGTNHVMAASGVWSGGDMFVAPTRKIYFDNGGDTYIYEPSADRIDFSIGGAITTVFLPTRSAFTQDVSIEPTKKLYLDGGGNTYIKEESADIIAIVAGAVSAMKLADSGVIVGAPTGSFKGAGTLNAVAVYDDNVLLTDWVFDLHYDGTTAHRVPEGGRLYAFEETMASTKVDRRLPWMPTRDTLEQERSLGGMISRLWFGQEQQQIYLAQHKDSTQGLAEKIDELEAKLAALASRLN